LSGYQIVSYQNVSYQKSAHRDNPVLSSNALKLWVKKKKIYLQF